MDEEALERQAKATDKKIGIAIAALLLVGLIGWMNRCRYEHIHSTEGSEKIARINRLTGQICYSQNDGSWNPTRFPAQPKPQRA
jgi:hypothetical protein